MKKLGLIVALVAILGCDQKPNLTVVPLKLDCAVTLTWVAPTQYEDNSPLAPEDIQKFTINWFNKDQTTIVNTDVNDPTAITWVFLNMPTGKMSFRMTVTDVDNIESDWSNMVTKTFDDDCG